MAKRKVKRPLILTALLLLAIVIITIAVAQIMAKSMVSDYLKRKLPSHVQLNYRQMNVNVLTGTIELEDVDLELFNRDTIRVHTKADMKRITLEGLGYWQFFVKKNIDIDQLRLQKPEVTHFLYKLVPRKPSKAQGIVQLLKSIHIRSLLVTDGALRLFQEGRDSLAFEVKDVHFDLKHAKTGPELIKEKIPVVYEDYKLSAKDLFVDLGPFERLGVGEVLLENGNTLIKQLELNSKYGKQELSNRIKTERDHIALTIPETSLETIEVGFRRDTLFITTGQGRIIGPSAEIFRDKLVDDDLTRKKLYSQMLRELPIVIDIPKVEIIDGELKYSELVKAKTDPGPITFNELNATLHNISNDSEKNDKVTIAAEAKLMNHAPIRLDWSFEVSKENDAFTASGEIKEFNTTSINAFLESNLRAKAEGTINALYFTISGNEISSTGDTKMSYEDFAFSVLKKNRLGVNKLLTAIANIFINDGSNADAEGFRHGSIHVERDATKSFFNYLWLNVREGTINTLTSKK